VPCFFVGLAVLTRPIFLPAALCLPLLWWIRGIAVSRPTRYAPHSLITLAILLGLLYGQGLWNQQHGGNFRILPWQGAYNLYAANREGANGQYYTQRVLFVAVPEGQNTTRMESELLYREATGQSEVVSIDAMNAYWRERLFESIAAQPLGWLELMGRKLLYAFNNWEAYNNLTYAYHKARIPILAWNPLGWGLLLTLATAGVVWGARGANRSHLLGLGWIGLAYLAGLLLFFVSARFRLPLAPLLAIAAGGCVFWPAIGRPSMRHWTGLVICICVLVLSFGNWAGARSEETFLQDEILMAKAYSQLGRDAEAVREMESALTRAPNRSDLQAMQIKYLFNLWLSDPVAMEIWDRLDPLLQTASQWEDAGLYWIAGLNQYRLGAIENARELWELGASESEASGGVNTWTLLASSGHTVDEGATQVQEIRALLRQLRQTQSVD